MTLIIVGDVHYGSTSDGEFAYLPCNGFTPSLKKKKKRIKTAVTYRLVTSVLEKALKFPRSFGVCTRVDGVIFLTTSVLMLRAMRVSTSVEMNSSFEIVETKYLGSITGSCAESL